MKGRPREKKSKGLGNFFEKQITGQLSYYLIYLKSNFLITPNLKSNNRSNPQRWKNLEAQRFKYEYKDVIPLIQKSISLSILLTKFRVFLETVVSFIW